MLKAGNKHPLKESLGAGGNSGPSISKRSRFENIVLLREEEENSESSRSSSRQEPRQILRAGRKRKNPPEGRESVTSNDTTVNNTSSPPSSSNVKSENDENDIINELAKEFKKARLRPVFFTISSFIEQTVDEVGFTVAEDEPETEVTIRLKFRRERRNQDDKEENTDVCFAEKRIPVEGQQFLKVEADVDSLDIIPSCKS